MLSSNKIHTLKCGNTISYSIHGQADGIPTYYIHDTLGSRLECKFTGELASKFGVTIFALDRPGYGSSNRCKDFSLLKWAAYVQEFADCNGHDKFGIIAVSGGCPYALAMCANSDLSKRISFVYIISGYAPLFQNPHLLGFYGKRENCFITHIKKLRTMRRLVDGTLIYVSKNMSKNKFHKFIQTQIKAGPDKVKISEKASWLGLYQDILRESTKQGIDGYLDDLELLYGDWGFDLKDIKARIHFYHGKEDKVVPFKLALFNRRCIDRSVLHEFDGQGHILPDFVFEHVLDEIYQTNKHRSGIEYQ